MMRPVIIPLVLLLLAALSGIARAYCQDNQEDEAEESAVVAAIRRIPGAVFPLYTFSKTRKDLFDLGFLSAGVTKGPYAKFVDLRLRFSKMTIPIGFSFYIENRVYGSPAWDEVALPRHSLNIDPITGLYYWDK